jgi:hypothetical protein
MTEDLVFAMKAILLIPVVVLLVAALAHIVAVSIDEDDYT